MAFVSLQDKAGSHEIMPDGDNYIAHTWRIFTGLFIFVAVLIILVVLWFYDDLKNMLDLDAVTGYLRAISRSPVAFWWLMSFYALSAIVFFPLMILNTAVILVFTGMSGLIYAVVGSMLTAIIGYVIGRFVGRDKLEYHFPTMRKLLKKIGNSGFVGVAVIRMLPVPPYAVSNIIFGVIKIPLWMFMAGTFFGILPSKIMLSLFGTSFRGVIENQNSRAIIEATVLFIGWIGVILLCNRFARKWQDAHR